MNRNYIKLLIIFSVTAMSIRENTESLEGIWKKVKVVSKQKGEEIKDAVHIRYIKDIQTLN